jgi:hypothetical protein
MNTTQPKALVLADQIDAIENDGADPDLVYEAAAELRRLHQQELALKEWLDKTEWVQETSEAHELGMHRADVLAQRIDRLVNTLAETHATYQAKLLADEALLRQALDCLENHCAQRTYAGGVVISNTAIAIRARLTT